MEPDNYDHHHVMFAMSGYLPETNDVVIKLDDAKKLAKEWVNDENDFHDWDDNGFGTHYDCSKPNCIWHVTVEPCNDSDCVKVNEDGELVGVNDEY